MDVWEFECMWVCVGVEVHVGMCGSVSGSACGHAGSGSVGVGAHVGMCGNGPWSYDAPHHSPAYHGSPGNPVKQGYCDARLPRDPVFS